MKMRSFLFVVAGLALVACKSDAEIICDKADECNLLEAGFSVDECVEQFEKEYTESQREDCADCADDKSCSTIRNGGCDADCP